MEKRKSSFPNRVTSFSEKASKVGFPALANFLNASVPFLTRLTPYLGGLVPVIDYINSYRAEIASFFANSAAAAMICPLWQ